MNSRIESAIADYQKNKAAFLENQTKKSKLEKLDQDLLNISRLCSQGESLPTHFDLAEEKSFTLSAKKDIGFLKQNGREWDQYITPIKTDAKNLQECSTHIEYIVLKELKEHIQCAEMFCEIAKRRHLLEQSSIDTYLQVLTGYKAINGKEKAAPVSGGLNLLGLLSFIPATFSSVTARLPSISGYASAPSESTITATSAAAGAGTVPVVIPTAQAASTEIINARIIAEPSVTAAVHPGPGSIVTLPTSPKRKPARIATILAPLESKAAPKVHDMDAETPSDLYGDDSDLDSGDIHDLRRNRQQLALDVEDVFNEEYSSNKSSFCGSCNCTSFFKKETKAAERNIQAKSAVYRLTR